MAGFYSVFWQCVDTLVGHSDRVNDVFFNADGNTVVSSGNDKTIRLWDLKMGEEIFCFFAHSAGVDSIALFPDVKVWLVVVEMVLLRFGICVKKIRFLLGG